VSDVRVVPFEARHLDATLAMMRQWSPEHPELGERSLVEWQRCARYVALKGETVVGQICQVSHEFRYGSGTNAGSAPVRIGWGITLVLDMSDDATRKAAGRQLLATCEEAPGLKYAAVGVVPAIEPAYLRRGHQLTRDASSYFARFFAPSKALAYWKKATWLAPAVHAANLVFQPETRMRHGSVERITRFDPAWDATWDRLLAARYELYGQRDAEYLNYKLAQPNRDYHAYVHRGRDGAVDGYVVFRRARHRTRDMDLVKICDFAGTAESLQDLFATAVRFARTEARGTYGIVALSAAVDAPLLKRAGLFVAQPYPVVVAAGVPGKMRVSFFDSDLDDLW
jgi:hypothetical protein